MVKTKKKTKHMGDVLQNLPTDQVPPTQEEKDMISWLYQNPKEYIKNTVTHLAIEFRSVVWLGVVFFLFSLSYFDTMIGSFVPFFGKHPIYLSFVKTLLFILIAWLVLNITYLSKSRRG